MDWFDTLPYFALVIGGLLLFDFVSGFFALCCRPTPSPMERVADYSEEPDDLDLDF